MTTTTTTETPVTCPPSDVAAEILYWTESDGTLNVHAGDLVLYGDAPRSAELWLVTAISTWRGLFGRPLVRVEFRDLSGPRFFNADSRTAVCRYLEG